MTLLPQAVALVALEYTADDVAMNNVKIFIYTRAFGTSTLFLVLLVFMARSCRFGNDARPLMVIPMVSFGKIVWG